MAQCDVETQYYKILASNQRECVDYTDTCDVRRSLQACSENGTVNFCYRRQQYFKLKLNGTNDRICYNSLQCLADEYLYQKQITDHRGLLVQAQQCRQYVACAPDHYYAIRGPYCIPSLLCLQLVTH